MGEPAWRAYLKPPVVEELDVINAQLFALRKQIVPLQQRKRTLEQSPRVLERYHRKKRL